MLRYSFSSRCTIPFLRYNLNVASDTGFPSKRVLPTPASALYDDTDHVDISTGDWVVVYTQSYLQQPAEYLAGKYIFSKIKI